MIKPNTCSGVQKSETTCKIRDVFHINMKIIRKSGICVEAVWNIVTSCWITWLIRFL
ncbi:hypothetical protein LDENG_00213410 [Lucifuga dentata]|nr:hypothetical protein LDENG_00213410 [Lucifuga dentata]